MSAIPEIPPPLKPLRPDLIATAVNFLNDPQVKAAPLSKRLAFLEGKGLTQEEIDLAIMKSNKESKEICRDGHYGNNQIPFTSQAQKSQSSYKSLILTTAILLGTSSLFISNYQSIKSFALKLFKKDDDDQEIKRLEREFKESIKEIKDLMEEKEKKLQETLENFNK